MAAAAGASLALVLAPFGSSYLSGTGSGSATFSVAALAASIECSGYTHVDAVELPPGSGVTASCSSDGSTLTLGIATGLPGAVGPAGSDGATGPAGAQGIPGETGPAGLPGADGAPGAAGADGLPGADGAPGPVGPTGPSGPPGADGATGPVGPPGADGAPGQDGQNGTSVTTQALTSSTGPCTSSVSGVFGAQFTDGTTTSFACTGAQGSSSSPSYTVVYGSTNGCSSVNGADCEAHVLCPAGKHPVSGGAYTYSTGSSVPGNFNLRQVALSGSWPWNGGIYQSASSLSTATGWQAGAMSFGSGYSLAVYAVCG